MTTWLAVALAMTPLAVVLGPEGQWLSNLLLLSWKLLLLSAAAFLGYWLDRTLFPYGRPDDWLDEPRVFSACQVRRAIVVGCCLLGMGAAL